MLELGEKRGGREFEKVGQKVQAAVMRHLNENVFHAGLCLYTLSDNGGHEDEARRTLGKRPEERIERGEYRFLALELAPLQVRELEPREPVEHIRARYAAPPRTGSRADAKTRAARSRSMRARTHAQCTRRAPHLK